MTSCARMVCGGCHTCVLLMGFIVPCAQAAPGRRSAARAGRCAARCTPRGLQPWPCAPRRAHRSPRHRRLRPPPQLCARTGVDAAIATAAAAAAAGAWRRAGRLRRVPRASGSRRCWAGAPPAPRPASLAHSMAACRGSRGADVRRLKRAQSRGRAQAPVAKAACVLVAARVCMGDSGVTCAPRSQSDKRGTCSVLNIAWTRPAPGSQEETRVRVKTKPQVCCRPGLTPRLATWTRRRCAAPRARSPPPPPAAAPPAGRRAWPPASCWAGPWAGGRTALMQAQTLL